MDTRLSRAVITSIVVILCLCCRTGHVEAQTCTKVKDTRVLCANAVRINVAMACGQNYIMRVYSAEYYVSDIDVCPDRDDDLSGHCFVDDVTAMVQTECDHSSLCVVPLDLREVADCDPNGKHYVKLVMVCEPLQFLNAEKAAVTTITNDRSYGGYQLVYINSDAKIVEQKKGDFKDTTLGCEISIPPRLEVYFQILDLYKSSSSSDCDQAIEVWDGATFAESLCKVDVSDYMTAGCSTNGTKIYMRYKSSDPDATVGFVVSVGISHRATGFTVKCGLPVSSMPQVFVPTEPPTTPRPGGGSGNSGGGGDGDDDDELFTPDGDGASGVNVNMIITSVGVLVGLLILAAVIGTVVRKLRQRKRDKEDDDDVEELHGRKNQSFVRDIYLDGQTKAKLVMERGKNKLLDSSMGTRIAS